MTCCQKFISSFNVWFRGQDAASEEHHSRNTHVVGNWALDNLDFKKVTTKEKYIDYYDYNGNKVKNLIESKNANDKLDGLLYTVLGSGDFDKSDKLIFQLADSDILILKQNAILCIGHLVRIHKQIDLERYIPIIESVLLSQNESLVDNAESALNDIWTFYDKEKIKQIKSDTCVSRYFNVLQISERFESEENYDKGLRTIKELEKAELNPSVQRIQRTCIEYLNNFQ